MTAVELQIVFDPSGAVTGFKQIGDAGGAMGTKVVSAAEAATLALNNQTTASSKAAGQIAILTAQWEAEQAAVNNANKALVAQSSTVSAATSSFQGLTSEQTRANVAGRLLEQTFGLQNRALNQVISRSSALGPILAGAFNIAIFASVVPMIEKIGEGIINATDYLGGYTAAVKQAYKDTVTASNQAFIDPKSLAQSQANLTALNKTIETLEKQKQALAEGSGVDTDLQNLQAAGADYEAQIALQQTKTLIGTQQEKAARQDIDELLKNQAALAKQLNEAQFAADAKMREVGLQGFALIAQQYKDAHLAIDVNGRMSQVDPQVTAQKQRDATADYLNAKLSLERQNASQTIALHHQVVEDSLQGEARIYQIEVDQLSDIDRLEAQGLITHTDAQARRADTVKRFSDQIVEYERQQTQETISLQDQATIAGLQGDAKLIASAQKKYDEQYALYQRGQTDQATFNARIDALAIALDDELSDADTQRFRKTKELQEQAAADFVTAQEDATLAVVPEWQRQTAQLEIELNRRLRAIQDEQVKELAAQNLTQAQVAAINQIADAKRADAIVTTNQRIVEENQRMAQQLGSDLQSAFDDATSGNLGKRILANFEKLFFQIVAQWILSVGIMKSTFGSLLGALVFGPGSTAANVFGGGLNPLSFLGIGAQATPVAAAAGAAGVTGASAQSFSLPGLTGGSGLGAAIAGTSATTSLTSASTALNTQTMAQALALPGLGIGSGLASPATNKVSTANGGYGIVGQTLSSLGPIGVMLASAFGGTPGMIGGALTMGSMTLIPKLASMLGINGIGPAILGASLAYLGAGLTGFGLGSSQGGLIGALGGAGSGALSGFLIGGPIGAAIGGVIGLLGGIFGGIFGGSKRKRQANDYANNTVLPDIQQIVTGFDGFQIDSSSAIQQLEQLRTDSQKQLATLKSQGNDVFKNTVSPAIDAAEKHINDTQNTRNTRSNTLFGPPQFDTGGMFSVMPGGNAGLAVLHDGEFVVNPQATKKNLSSLAAMNAGASASGLTINGDLNINTPTLDRKYVKSKQFTDDLIFALGRAQTEGRI